MFAKKECSPKRNVRQKGMFAKKECSPKRNVRQKGMFAKKECSPKERGVCDVVKKVEMV
jgi:hypothetical protein